MAKFFALPRKLRDQIYTLYLKDAFRSPQDYIGLEMAAPLVGESGWLGVESTPSARKVFPNERSDLQKRLRALGRTLGVMEIIRLSSADRLVHEAIWIARGQGGWLYSRDWTFFERTEKWINQLFLLRKRAQEEGEKRRKLCSK